MTQRAAVTRALKNFEGDLVARGEHRDLHSPYSSGCYLTSGFTSGLLDSWANSVRTRVPDSNVKSWMSRKRFTGYFSLSKRMLTIFWQTEKIVLCGPKKEAE